MMIRKKDRRDIVKLLKSDSYKFQNQILQTIFFASPTKREDIYDEIQSNALLNSKLMNSLYKGSFARFDKIQYCYNPELSDKDAIKIACNLIMLFGKKIEKYISLREKYENYYLNKNYDKAVELLDRIDVEICTSLWSCGQRFLIKQMSIGLEGNKRELSKLSEMVPHNFLAQATLFFYSCMAETDMSYENYQAEVSKYLNGMESSAVGRYLVNKINFDSMFRYQDISLTVQIDCFCSIIDAYNSVEIYLPVCYKDEICAGTIDAQIYRLGIGQSNLFNNLTMVCMDTIDTLSYQTNRYQEVYTIIEYYTMGNYLKAIEKAEKYLAKYPSDFQIATLFCKALIIYNFPIPDTIQFEYIRSVYSIYSLNSDYYEAVAFLKQEAKKNHGLIFGKKMFSFLIRKHVLNGETTATFASSLLDPIVHPNFAQHLSGDNLNRFERIMSKLCPCSISLVIAEQIGDFKHDKLQNIDINKGILAQARWLCKNEQYNKAYEIIKPLQEPPLDSNLYIKERVNRILLTIYKGKQNHDLAIKLLVDIYFGNEFLFKHLNNSGIYMLPPRIRDRTIQKEQYYTVYLFLVDRGDLKRQLVGYSNYLDQNGYTSIIDALSLLDKSIDIVTKFFFENVCSIGLLKRDATLKMLNISPEEARICILSKLMDFYPQKKYLTEISTILTSETIKENLNTINKSRINVDTDKIFLTHRSQWEQSYRKYLALSDFGPLFIDLNLDDYNISKFDAVYLQQKSTKRTTQEIVVFNNILKQIEDECLFSVQYGLETYLSSRIRHGYCKGQLTSFLSDLHLLSMRTNEKSNEYFLNEYWDSKIPPYVSAKEDITTILSEFTKNIESKINEILKYWLRIKRDTQSEGMFDYAGFVPACTEAFVDEHIQDFTTFYNRIIDAFWEYSEEILKKVRMRINEELTEYYINAISIMETNLQGIPEPLPALNELLTNCKLAKARVTSAMMQFAEVFSADNAPYNNFTMSDLTVSCRRAVEKVHSESSAAKWIINADKKYEFRGKFFAPFVDILCIFLNNAIEHSGIEKMEKLQISIKILELDEQGVENYRKLGGLKGLGSEKHFFEMKITNTLNPSLSQKDLEAKLDESFKKIRGGTNIQELIQSEGGSGLYKLCNIAQYNIETEYLITYGVGDNTVSFSYCFPADKLICKEIVDDNTIN